VESNAKCFFLSLAAIIALPAGLQHPDRRPEGGSGLKKLLIPALVAMALLCGCNRERAGIAATGADSFPVYPGSQYLPDLTELFRKAGTVTSTRGSVPPQVLYDTDASLEDVASYYSKQNGFPSVAPSDAPATGGTKPGAFYRTGDLNDDTRAIEPIIRKLNLTVDVAKATGKYRGAHISGDARHPRVTLSRPYFDPTKSQVVNRTLIIMVRE
jgi:hypothetical protein